MIRLYYGKILWRIYSFFEKSAEFFLMKLLLIHVRNEAHIKRKEVIKRKGRSALSSHVKSSIKDYAKKRFGKADYWPCLAHYTELRGEFIEGWLPYDYYRFVLLPKINPKPATYISDFKTFDYRLFGEFAVRPLFALVSGIFLNSEFEIIDKGQFMKFMFDYDNLIVVKEDLGWGGSKVRIIHSSSLIIGELKDGKNYLIQPYVKQYKVLNDLYPDCLNTFRITTYLKTDGSVIVKFVELKFGIDGLKVDNICAGGNYLLFDLTGRPIKSGFDKWDLEIGDRHKNTRYLFSDLEIPMFNEMLEKCKNAHKKFPYTRLIGWDVCIDSNGEPKLIEWNTNNPAFPHAEALIGPLYIDNENI